ncbi:Nicotinate-nucleotide--dimethylbenzimidazole phosphoribosyltransferase [compost metagenome]
MAAAAAHQEILTKPPRALGRLETLSIQLAGITGQACPSMARKAILVMAGDHGVVAEGVSAFPAEVTPQMVLNFLNGGAAVNVLGRHVGARVVVTDVGVAADLDAEGLRSRKVRPGTANMAQGPAMTREEALSALQVGIDLVAEEIANGLNLIAIGEMGIGNTTPSAALVAVLTGQPVERVTGRGTGISEQVLAHKVRVIERALALNAPDPTDPLDVLAKVGGLEIAAMAGVILAAAFHRRPVVLDGFISGAAALVAARLNPLVTDYLFPSHLSVEQGHRIVLDALGLEPFFDLEMRLGEGSGAALAMGLIEASAKLLGEMATFAGAGVSTAAEQGR